MWYEREREGGKGEGGREGERREIKKRRGSWGGERERERRG